MQKSAVPSTFAADAADCIQEDPPGRDRHEPPKTESVVVIAAVPDRVQVLPAAAELVIVAAPFTPSK
jgi:hypothetical protein